MLGEVYSIRAHRDDPSKFSVAHTGSTANVDIYAQDELSALTEYRKRQQKEINMVRTIVICTTVFFLALILLVAYKEQTDTQFRTTVFTTCLKAGKGYKAGNGGVQCG